MIRIGLFGAGGKMGTRLTDHLIQHPDYEMRYVETGERGRANLKERNIPISNADEVASTSDVLILALPDRVLGKAAREIVPKAKPNTLIITLDPAAAHAGELPVRKDVSYFVTHPCHPSVFD